MSTVVDPFIKRLNQIERDVPNIIKQILIDNKEFVLDLLKYGQLEKGIRSDGKIAGWYSERTQVFARKQGVKTPKIPNTPYNFFWSGNTVENLKVSKVTKSVYDITTVPKMQKLLEEIHGELFDLTEEHNEYINNEILYPKFIEYLLEESVRGLI